MKRFAIGFAALWFALGATRVLAVTSAIRYATITGTASAPSGSQCTQGYANLCPSGSCSCVQVPGAVVGRVSGKPAIDGTGTADLFLTFDNGAATVSAAGDCTPFFGIARLTTTRLGSPSSETLNLNGVHCAPITTADSPILGGFGIATSPAPVNGGKGYGKVNGFLDPSGSLSLTLHGLITE
jgi:hypothetical protein